MGYFITQQMTTYPFNDSAMSPGCVSAKPGLAPGGLLYMADASRSWFAGQGTTLVPADFNKKVYALHSVGSTQLAQCMVEEGTYVPTMPPLESVFKSSTRTAGFRKRVRNGEIILNPRSVSTLRVEDVLRAPPGAKFTTLWAALCQPLSTYKTVQPCRGYPGAIMEVPSWYPGWKFSAALKPTSPTAYTAGNPSVVNIGFRYYSTGSPLSFMREFGVSRQFVDGVRRSTVQHILGSSPMDEALVTRVVGDAYSGIYDVLTDIAELPETVRTVHTQIERISALYDIAKGRADKAERRLRRLRGRYNKEHSSEQKRAAIKRKQKREIHQVSKEISGLWLEFRYGIMPMVYSIQDATEWLQTTDYEYFKYRATKTQKVQVSVFGYMTEVEVVHRAFAKLRVNSKVAGLKLNPYTTALEKVKLSLLLNWVCNVGDLLSALYEPNGVVEQKFSYSRQVVQGPMSLGGHASGEIPPTVTFGLYDLRVIDPKKYLVFKFQNNMNLKRLVDAFALVWGQTRWRFK